MISHCDYVPYQLLSIFPFVVGRCPNFVGKVVAMFGGNADVHCREEVWRWELGCGLVVPHGRPETEAKHRYVGSVAEKYADWRFPIEGLDGSVVQTVDHEL